MPKWPGWTSLRRTSRVREGGGVMEPRGISTENGSKASTEIQACPMPWRLDPFICYDGSGASKWPATCINAKTQATDNGGRHFRNYK